MKIILKTIVFLHIIVFIGSCNTDDDLSYTCSSGNCVEDADGAFATMAECENSCGGGGSGITDLDGNFYTSVVIGTQEWMVENLKTTKYANGDEIPNMTENSGWTNLSSGAWSHYTGESQYEGTYGKLYNWFAVADSRGLCPLGWHVPSDAEWTVLTDYLGGTDEAGGKMKSTGTQYWQSPNTDATNQSGFSGRPGGGRPAVPGNVYDIGRYGGWWSSTDSPPHSALYRYLAYNSGSVAWSGNSRRSGFSVRCIKD